jgi:guanine deaminase
MTALVHKARGGDYRRWPTAAEALDMCTSAASVCTGHGERLGRIETGAKGDLILLPLDSPALTPLHDPVRQLVYGVPSADIRNVVVDGRVVVADGKPVGVDVARLIEQAGPFAEDSLAGERPADAAALESMVDDMYRQVESTELDVDSYLRS